jgi:hypothetical protein
MKEILEPFNRKGEMVLEAGSLESGWFENRGQDGFTFHAFPAEAQLAPVFSIAVADVNGDRRPDIILGGNDEGSATIPGRSDAFCGLVLAGKGKGAFRPAGILQSGFFAPGDIRSITMLQLAGRPALAVAQHQGALKIFQARK